METRLLAYDHAAAASAIANWANRLPGKEVPNDPGYTVVRVIQFQMTSGQSGYDALLLVEVTQKEPEVEVSLREADVEAIEEITSSIDEQT